MNYPVSILLSAMLAMSLAACQKKEESMSMPETSEVAPPSPEFQFGAPPVTDMPPATSEYPTPPAGENQPSDVPPNQPPM